MYLQEEESLEWFLYGDVFFVRQKSKNIHTQLRPPFYSQPDDKCNEIV